LLAGVPCKEIFALGRWGTVGRGGKDGSALGRHLEYSCGVFSKFKRSSHLNSTEACGPFLEASRGGVSINLRIK
jgi:hypothetical protein